MRYGNRVGGIRHFTVTTFVSTSSATLLHWHRKVRLWLPPGGHIEPNEDPIQAAEREALEETGMQVEVLPTVARYDYEDPPQLPSPATIMVEPIGDFGEEPAHQHIDLIYFARPIQLLGATGSDDADRFAKEPGGWRWVSREQLENGAPLTLAGVTARISDDVVRLGIAAIDHVRRCEEAAS